MIASAYVPSHTSYLPLHMWATCTCMGILHAYGLFVCVWGFPYTYHRKPYVCECPLVLRYQENDDDII